MKTEDTSNKCLVLVYEEERVEGRVEGYSNVCCMACLNTSVASVVIEDTILSAATLVSFCNGGNGAILFVASGITLSWITPAMDQPAMCHNSLYKDTKCTSGLAYC